MPRPPAKKAAQIKTFKAWSFTRYNDHRMCPLFAKLKHLDKMPTPKSPAMERGAAIAQASEDFLRGRTKKLHPDLHTFKDEYRFYVKQKNLIVEDNWGFDKNWNPVRWDDWNNCVLRVKIDVGYIDLKDNELHIRDGKSGKFRPEKNEEYMLQLELYSAAGIAMYPNVSRVIPRLNYTDLGITFPDGEKTPDVIYTAKEARALQTTWDKRVKPLLNDVRFPPKPGRHCGWCPFRASAGGPCKY